MAQSFYLWDVTSQVWRGRVVLSIPKIAASNSECMSQLRTITGGNSGRFLVMSDNIFSGILSFFSSSTLTMPYPSSINGANIENGEGASVLIASVKSLSSLGNLVSGQHYRLCCSPENHEDDYLDFTTSLNSTTGMNLETVKVGGVFHNFSNKGIGFSVLYNSTTGVYRNAYLNFCAFTTDGSVSCNTFAPGIRANIGFYADGDTSHIFENWYNKASPIPEDPYAPGGTTGPDGGDGTGPEGIINDDIDFPTPLAISASNANFISIWTPTLDQVQTLAKWMWTTDPLKWEFWQKLLQNPLDLIFSLTIMPVPIYHPDEGGTPVEGELVAQTDSLSLGWQNTGIRMDWVPEQYVTIDMGTINLEEVWGAFLDYEPYTKIDIFLPYIGTKQLDTNDCMPRSISLRYVIDLATGTCVALIKCDNSVYYHFSGNCASQIPITVNQCQEIVRGLMTMAVGAATFAIGGPMGAGAHASKAAIAKGAAMKAGGAAMVGSGADSAAKGVNVSRSGVIGAAAGLMDVQTPYLIISRPRQAVPEDQNKYTGYPSFITEQIGDLSGYTEVQMIHLHNMSCTDEEYKEIDSLLTQGVII